MRLIRTLGGGCLLAKLDLKEAYRAVPVHPSDQRLLGVAWDDTVYIDKALPFGLRSASKIFSALTDAMMWLLQEKGIPGDGSTWYPSLWLICSGPMR